MMRQPSLTMPLRFRSSKCLKRQLIKIVLAVSVIFVPAIGEADERECLPFKSMETWEIRQELAGHELRGYSLNTKARWSERLFDSGVTEFKNSRGDITLGRWRLSGNALCFSYGTMTEWTCKTVHRASANCKRFRYALVNEKGQLASAIFGARRLASAGRHAEKSNPSGGQGSNSRALDAAIAREKSWSKKTRMGVQNALIWSGDYFGTLNGRFGTPTRKAIKSFQRRIGSEPTGYLTQSEIQSLERARLDAVRIAGFQVVDDFETGIRVGLPLGLFRRGATSSGLVEFNPIDRSAGLGLSLISMLGNANDIARFHQVFVSEELSGKAPYSLLKPDWFVVAGARDGVRTYVFLQFEDGALKGFIFSWPDASHARYAHLPVAILNSFEAIPGSVLRPKPGELSKLPDKFPSQPESTPRSKSADASGNKTTSNEGKREAESAGTGFIVDSKGRILTNAHVVRRCGSIMVGKGTLAKILAIDDELDLAILYTEGVEWPAVARFAAKSARLNSDVTVIGYPLHGLLGGINVTRGAVSSGKGLGGRITEFQITAAVQPGNSGGPVLNAAGAVVGVVRSKLNAIKVADAIGDIPQNINFAVRGEAAKLFMVGNGIKYELAVKTEPVPPADLAENAEKFTVLINCLP